MQIRNEQTTNTTNVGSPSNCKTPPRVSASASICAASDSPPLRPRGGVCGKEKLNNPSKPESPAAMKIGAFPCAIDSGSSLTTRSSPNTNPTIQPATIQPQVPNTRIPGNSFSGSVMLAKLIEFVSASVGI